MVELNYYNNLKRERKNGGKEESKEGKKRRKGGKGKGKKEREEKDLGRKIISRDDDSSVGGCVGRFFVESQGFCQKLGRGLSGRELQRDKRADRLLFGCGGAELLQ